MSDLLPIPTKRLRNDLWNRYIHLGKVASWRKEKIYQELKAANVEQRFTKTACKPGYDLYNMHGALRDILIENGLMTTDEWRSGHFKMSHEEWLTFYSNFQVVAKPIGPITFTLPPVSTHRANKARNVVATDDHQAIQAAFYNQTA